MKKTKEVIINGHTVTAIAETIGQQDPSVGNNVVVMGKLHLPATQYDYVVTDLQYRGTELLGDCLRGNWGLRDKIGEYNNRSKTIGATAATWAEAWGKVWKQLNEAIATLQKAQAEREAAFLAAGDPEYLD